MTSRVQRSAFVVALVAGAAVASADSTITAGYSFSFPQGIATTSFFAGPTVEEVARFNGQRLDLPPGPGTDTRVPEFFTAFCVEVDTFILNPSVHKVVTLAGSTTDVGGGGGSPAVFFDALRTERVERLWGGFVSSVVDPNSSAAFQLALWELCYDTDATLVGPGAYFVDAGQFQPGITDLAESWLAVVRSGAVLPRPSLVLLTAPGTQDVITIPGPGAVSLLSLAGLAAFRRRR
ncbi:MAG: hypothetical protein JNK35_07250 [Phycisphaerae bacterium]|nr:hypothetical protein [Phycisphaerae bacterium]